MIGLAFIAAFILYFSVSIGVVILVVRWARRRGRQPFIWGLLVALVMYHLVFWDYLPTLIVYNHYVKTKSGFWVYKTPEQWKEENPGVAVTLTWSKKIVTPYKITSGSDGYKLNERIAWVINNNPNSLFPVNAYEQLIVDIKTNEILVKQVRIFSGYSEGKNLFRFWANHVQPPSKSKSHNFGTLRHNYQQLGKEIK